MDKEVLDLHVNETNKGYILEVSDRQRDCIRGADPVRSPNKC